MVSIKDGILQKHRFPLPESRFYLSFCRTRRFASALSLLPLLSDILTGRAVRPGMRFWGRASTYSRLRPLMIKTHFNFHPTRRHCSSSLLALAPGVASAAVPSDQGCSRTMHSQLLALARAVRFRLVLVESLGVAVLTEISRRLKHKSCYHNQGDRFIDRGFDTLFPSLMGGC